MADSWSSVQIVTIIVDAATPVTVLVLGAIFARASRKIEQVQWANQTVVTRRLEIFDKLAPGLNQLLCFATFVGTWKDTDPRKAIAIKRDLDQTMYANMVLFSDELFTAYHQFMTVLFDMFGTTGADAKVRAPIESKWGSRRDLSWWNDGMSAQVHRRAGEPGRHPEGLRRAGRAVPGQPLRHPPGPAVAHQRGLVAFGV